jgi:hypothetical protein
MHEAFFILDSTAVIGGFMGRPSMEGPGWPSWPPGLGTGRAITTRYVLSSAHTNKNFPENFSPAKPGGRMDASIFGKSCHGGRNERSDSKRIPENPKTYLATPVESSMLRVELSVSVVVLRLVLLLERIFLVEP